MNDDSDRLETFFRSVQGGLEEPPAFFEETLDELDAMRATAPEAEVEAVVAAVRRKLFPIPSLGTVFRDRRVKLDADLTDVADAAHWDESELADLEEDRFDLSAISPNKIGQLLVVLRMPLEAIRDALISVAKEHLAVIRTPPGMGPVFGRTRKGVSPDRRRSGLMRGIGEMDEEATARAVAAYVAEVEETIEYLEG